MMILMGRTHEEGIWGLSSIPTDLINRKHPSLDGGFSDSNLHRPQVIFGVLSDHLENKIYFVLLLRFLARGLVDSINITALNLVVPQKNKKRHAGCVGTVSNRHGKIASGTGAGWLSRRAAGHELAEEPSDPWDKFKNYTHD